MPAPPEVLALIERFELHREDYQDAGYNETQLRREFLDPLFKALGWDIDNARGHAEAYKDVIHEDQIKVGGATKAPDYCFRIGGTRKFFLEAKKPSVNIEGDASPAYQLRRYAWSAKLPLSILSDFEETAVYDCRIKPDLHDKASTARVLFVRHDELAQRWDELAGIFSREAVLKGSFDKFAQSNKKKRGTAEVDAAFLADIELWRTELAKNLALRNPALDTRDLNFAVQRIIDRTIFLRIAEDRGIEDYGRLQSLLNGDAVYPRLGELFRHADDRYNSGIFHFEPEQGRSEPPDELTLDLSIDDKVLKEIIRGLYYPDSPYEFSVLSADILGQVYEQFLGKVIKLTAGHRAVVEDKPEVRKAGGVYYTPTYIVDYIVRQTVGTLLAGKTPKQAAKLRILDPACGSGSFLIGAYQFLLDWHLAWYVENGHKNEVNQDKTGAPRLTIAERKRILLNNIFGVDIDTQAVEVTKLSLLLKVLEGASREALERQRRLFHERALPDLGSNIKCGNSLIGPDFYDGQQLSLFDEQEQIRINAFDWRGKDGFAAIMKSGGFDAVIGNPPYIDSEWMTRYLAKTREYCASRYEAASGNWDIFCVFAERAIDLCSDAGISSLIVPNKLGAADYAAGARCVLSQTNTLRFIRDYSHVKVFPVSVYPIVYVVEKTPSSTDSPPVLYERMGIVDDGVASVAHSKTLLYGQYFSTPQIPWRIFNLGGSEELIDKVAAFPRLDTIATVLGSATVSEAYEIQKLISGMDGALAGRLRLANSGTIDRYACLWGLKECRYLGLSLLHPIVTKLNEHRLPAKRRQQSRSPKIIVAGMTKRLECIVDVDGDIIAGKSTTIVTSDVDLKFLLGVLNSRVANYFYSTTYGANKLQGGYLRIGPPQIRSVPIPIDRSSQLKGNHRKVVVFVNQMLKLHADLAKTKPGHAQTLLHRQIEATDRQIDRLVYQLYGLTEAEIALVESAPS